MALRDHLVLEPNEKGYLIGGREFHGDAGNGMLPLQIKRRYPDTRQSEALRRYCRADHPESKSVLGRPNVLVQHGCNVRNQTISQDPCAVPQILGNLQRSLVRVVGGKLTHNLSNLYVWLSITVTFHSGRSPPSEEIFSLAWHCIAGRMA
jgi:hypothetical protein